jgi:hypothetical protein
MRRNGKSKLSDQVPPCNHFTIERAGVLESVKQRNLRKSYRTMTLLLILRRLILFKLRLFDLGYDRHQAENK